MNLFERLTEETLTEGILDVKDTPSHVQQLAKLIGKATIWSENSPRGSYMLTFRHDGVIGADKVKKALRLKVTYMGSYNGMLTFWVDA